MACALEPRARRAAVHRHAPQLPAPPVRARARHEPDRRRFWPAASWCAPCRAAARSPTSTSALDGWRPGDDCARDNGGTRPGAAMRRPGRTPTGAVCGILRSVSLLALLLTSSFSTTPAAGPVTDERGLVGLQLMLRKLAVTGTVMHVTAHPDDENNSLMARQSHGQGLRVILATATRGNGGQNEIGPELFEALGVLRSEELRAAHRFDGAEQMFGRAIDFGYSFSVDETLREVGQGRDPRRLRAPDPHDATRRPDHDASGSRTAAVSTIRRRRCLGLEAFRAAGDPTRYPEQIARGPARLAGAEDLQGRLLRVLPRRARAAEGHEAGAVESDVYDPLLGRTYAEIGSEARAMHKCQGFGQLLALPGSFVGEVSAGRYHDSGQARRRTRPNWSTASICRCRVWRDLPGRAAGATLVGWPSADRRRRRRRHRRAASAG